MGIRKKRYSLLLTYFFCFLSLVFSSNVSAIEVVIGDNGSSGNSIVVNQTTDVQVTQENEAEVENNVTQDVNTGENTTSGNTSDSVNTQTGDITVEDEIKNDINNSTADIDCCEASSDIKVSGNGDGSQNNVEVSQGGDLDITVTNKASINSTIDGSANSGGNSAINNTGADINITTGNISIQNEIVNAPINTSHVKLASSSLGVNIAVNENGSGSVNDILYSISGKKNVSINNYLLINNFLSWNASTGGNSVFGNTGGIVNILTGDILIKTKISNLANVQDAEIQCKADDNDLDPGDDDPGEDETYPDNGRGGETDPGSSNDQSNSGSQGSILPSAAATEAGGPGIFGLSDTSGFTSNMFYFWLGFIFMTLGGKFIIDGLLFKTSKSVIGRN